MKTTLLSFAFISLVGHAAAAEVKLADCPAAVQATIQQNSRDGRIDEIESYSIQGKMLYVAEVELGGDRDLKIHVAADGALVKTREDSALSEVPEAVRKAVEGKLDGGIADDVDKETAGQTVTFHVEIDRKGAPDTNLTLDSAGKVLSETEEHD
ncbi:MAG: hypothetical protein EOP83_19830 [Verrucomicrobiaceae bacterium]|nr:MAG: hypothetical protein EOP83_19830 [Verrucomicrobiaceae bacterium]